MLEDGDRLIRANGAVQWMGVHGAHLATPPLLVLHGGPGAHNWIYEQSVAEAIACRRTLVLHEQRGCGRAGPAPGADYSIALLVADVQAAIDLLDVEQVDLLGWSFGADLAARVVLESPARVRRLVLQAPALDFTDDAVPEYLLSSYLSLASPAVREDVAGIVHGPGTPWERVHNLWPVLDGETADRVAYHQPEMAIRAEKLYAEFGIGTNMDMLTALTAHATTDSVMPRLGTIEQPTLVMTGAHDHNVDPRRTESIARAIPHAQTVLFADSAHMPELEEPRAYAEALLDFLSAVNK